MSFSLRFLLILTSAVFSASVSRAVTWYSVASGNAETAAIWSLTTVGPGSTAAALGGFNNTVDLVVQSGYTVDLYTTGNININTLQVDAGGVFYSTNTTNRYVNIYGNVICNGIIGGNGIYNSICFNIEGVNTVISGTGSFEASRMRKNAVLNPVTNLTIAMNMNLRWNSGTATQIYNNASATVFNVTISPGVTVNLISGNISIDGLSGNGFNEMSGTLTVNGTLNVSNALYMMTNNAIGGNSCNISIGSSGVIRTYQAVAGVSNVGGHNLLIAPGGKLELTGPSAFSSFSTNFNTYTCQPGSVVEYSYAGNQTVQTGLVYGHLYLSNSGVKTTNGNAVVQNDVLISGAAVLSPLSFSVSLQGNWINWGAAGMQEGTSTVIFNGNATQTITTAGGEQFFNCTVSRPTGTLDLNCNLNISGTFDFTSGIVNTTAVTLLHFLSGSAHVNASDLSFVNGPARKTGVSDFVFPVGKIGYLRPIGVFGLGANSVFTAEYFPADPQSIPTNVSALDPTIDHVSRCEYWSLTTPSFTEAFVSLTWNAATSCGVTSLPDLRVAQWETAIWRDRGNAGTSGTLISGTILSTELLTSFGFFTLSSTLSSQNPLPVEWLSFDVRKESESVILDWVTASEKNADYFEIQRSPDGVNFESLSRVAAAGNSSVATYYTYSDHDPFKGSSYYRLRQVDTDGAVDFSEVRHVNFRAAVFEYQVYYNSYDGTVNINLPETESATDYRIEFFTADGKVIFRDNLRSSHYELSSVRLPQGICFYRIIGSGSLIASGRLSVF